MNLSHIGICVSDAARSQRFYEDVLGFRRVRELQVKGEPAATLLRLRDLELEAIYLERAGVTIELLRYASPGHSGDGSPRALNALGITHFSFEVDDLDAACDVVASAGGRVLADTRIEVPGVGSKAIFASDPDGTLIELVQSTPA